MLGFEVTGFWFGFNWLPGFGIMLFLFETDGLSDLATGDFPPIRCIWAVKEEVERLARQRKIRFVLCILSEEEVSNSVLFFF